MDETKATGAPGPAVDSGASLSSAVGRGVLAATILGSSMAMLDGTIVTVASRRIGEDFSAGFGSLQWVVNGYLLPLSALILLGGALGDRFGRRRIFMIGVAWFCVSSFLCAVAPTIDTLIAARGLQGIGGALLTPGSLSLIQASIAPDDRARAVGLWSGLGGVTGALGPFVGGWLVEHASWRWAFGINLPLGIVVLALCLHFTPESKATHVRKLDLPGLALVVVALALLTLGATSGGDQGWSVVPIAEIAIGVALCAAFVVVERRSAHALVPPSLFANRMFTGTNLMTFCTYGALGVVLLVLTLQLQTTVGYSPLQAGIATLPMTVLLLLLSARSGALSARIGPKLQLIAGPLVAAAGLVLSLRIDATHHSYLRDVLPAVLLFGLGLALLVAPLTAAVMSAAPADSVGIASGVNNAVARSAGLLTVAILPPLAGLTGSAYLHPASMTAGYRGVTIASIVLLVAGAGVVALVVPRQAARSGGASAGTGEVAEPTSPTLTSVQSTERTDPATYPPAETHTKKGNQ